MRCPVCDYDPEQGMDNQSPYFLGLSLDIPPMPFVGVDGNMTCNCLSDDWEEEPPLDAEEGTEFYEKETHS